MSAPRGTITRMKSATVEQLQHDPASVLQWVEKGERVEISAQGRVVAVVSPPDETPTPNGSSVSKPIERPDFAARLKKRFGDKVIPAEVSREIIEFNRGRY